MNFESKYYFVDFEILFRLFLHSHHFQCLNSMAMLFLKLYAMNRMLPSSQHGCMLHRRHRYSNCFLQVSWWLLYNMRTPWCFNHWSRHCAKTYNEFWTLLIGRLSGSKKYSYLHYSFLWMLYLHVCDLHVPVLTPFTRASINSIYTCQYLLHLHVPVFTPFTRASINSIYTCQY